MDSVVSGLRVLVLRAPGGGGQIVPVDTNEFSVGSDSGADVSLAGDTQVAAVHTRVAVRGGRLLIRDAWDHGATLVHGSGIPSSAEIELEPGSEVTTGATTWTVLPPSWFVYRAGDVVIYGRISETVSYALFRCAMPVVDEVRAVNTGAEQSVPMTLWIEVERYAEPAAAVIPALKPGRIVSVEDASPQLSGEALRSVTEVSEISLRIWCENGGDEPVVRSVRVVGLTDWSHSPDVRQTIAAFVSPRDPEVERIVLDAQRGVEGFTGMLKRGNEGVELRVMEILYRHLANCGIRYEPPAADEGFQAVRRPAGIFRSESDRSAGAGNCLDLTVLFAGCLENVGLCPLVVLVGPDQSRPVHAFAGCWAGSTPSLRPVIKDAERLRSEVKSGGMYVMECTGFAEGAAASEGRISFEDALAQASARLNESDWACAVDVCSLRPPYGSVTPMWYPTLSPEVAQVCALALEFANSRMSKTLETTHLLFGLLSARGAVTERIFHNIGVDPGTVRSRLSSLLPMGNSVLGAAPTKNYRKCTRLAEQCADMLPGGMVREEHIWWAMVENRSKNFVILMSHIGVDIEEIGREVAELMPPRLLDMDQSSISIDAI